MRRVKMVLVTRMIHVYQTGKGMIMHARKILKNWLRNDGEHETCIRLELFYSIVMLASTVKVFTILQ